MDPARFGCLWQTKIHWLWLQLHKFNITIHMFKDALTQLSANSIETNNEIINRTS